MKIRENAEITVIDVTEDLGNHVTGELKQTLEAQNTLKIVMNLSEVKHISSTAIGALVGAAGIVEIFSTESGAAAAFLAPA